LHRRQAIPFRITHPGEGCELVPASAGGGEVSAAVVCEGSADAATVEREGIPGEPVDDAPWWLTIFTSMFLHAGLLHIGNAEQITEEQWDETFNVNVRGLWLLSRAVLPHMRKAGGGSIINVASVLGINGARLRAAYASSKGAVILLTKCMAVDYGPENIRVNAICPSFIETDLTAEVIRKAPKPETVRKERIGVHPIGRLGQPEDVAGMAVFLASDESNWVTGSALAVDGGYLAI